DKHTFIDESPELKLIGKPDVDVYYIAEEQTAYRTGATAVKPVEVIVPAVYHTRVGYLKIKTKVAGVQDVVTVVELLSPANKFAGKGRTEYIRKRNKVLSSGTSLVEVNLLRAGKPMPMEAPV